MLLRFLGSIGTQHMASPNTIVFTTGFVIPLKEEIQRLAVRFGRIRISVSVCMLCGLWKSYMPRCLIQEVSGLGNCLVNCHRTSPIKTVLIVED